MKEIEKDKETLTKSIKALNSEIDEYFEKYKKPVSDHKLFLHQLSGLKHDIENVFKETSYEVAMLKQAEKKTILRKRGNDEGVSMEQRK